MATIALNSLWECTVELLCEVVGSGRGEGVGLRVPRLK
jgi:hypothetical protein